MAIEDGHTENQIKSILDNSKRKDVKVLKALLIDSKRCFNLEFVGSSDARIVGDEGADGPCVIRHYGNQRRDETRCECF